MTLKERFQALMAIARIQYVFVNLRKEKFDEPAAGSAVRKYATAFKNDTGRGKKSAGAAAAQPETIEHLFGEDDDDGDACGLDVAIGLLVGDNDERQYEVGRQEHGEHDGANRPRVPRSVPIPHPLPDAIHDARLNAGKRRAAAIGDAARSPPKTEHPGLSTGVFGLNN